MKLEDIHVFLERIKIVSKSFLVEFNLGEVYDGNNTIKEVLGVVMYTDNNEVLEVVIPVEEISTFSEDDLLERIRLTCARSVASLHEGNDTVH